MSNEIKFKTECGKTMLLIDLPLNIRNVWTKDNCKYRCKGRLSSLLDASNRLSEYFWHPHLEDRYSMAIGMYIYRDYTKKRFDLFNSSISPILSAISLLKVKGVDLSKNWLVFVEK